MHGHSILSLLMGRGFKVLVNMYVCNTYILKYFLELVFTTTKLNFLEICMSSEACDNYDKNYYNCDIFLNLSHCGLTN